MKQTLLILILLLTSGSLQAQTDFPALKQQFLDYRKAKNQDSALYIARKMNQLALKEQSDTSYWYALSMRYQGNPHETWGNMDSTIYYWKRSVDFFEKYHPNIADYGISLNNLALLYSDMGDYMLAEPLYKQSLEINKKVLGVEHPYYVMSLNNLGILYYESGDYKSAELLYKQALEITKITLGEEHPDVASSLNRLGVLYSEMGDYESAEPLYKRAIAINLKTLGDEHPSYALSLNNLGVWYYEMGDYKSAEPYYKESIKIYKKSVGEEHPEYASNLIHLGRFCRINFS